MTSEDIKHQLIKPAHGLLLVNMVLNVHRNHKTYQGRGERAKGVWRWGKRGKRETIIPVATLSPPE